MQTLFSVLLILQFLVNAGHDWVDIPGWVNGTQVQSIVGRRKLILGTLINAIFPGLAVAFALVFWRRPPTSYASDYWAIYCAITVASAIAMWYIPYFFGASEKTRQDYTRMYEGTLQVLPPRGDNPRPNLFHIFLHALFATTLVLALMLRFRHT